MSSQPAPPLTQLPSKLFCTSTDETVESFADQSIGGLQGSDVKDEGNGSDKDERSSSKIDQGDPEVTDEELRREYIKLMEAHKKRFVQDKADVRKGLRRERWFTIDYNRMSRNKLWAAKEGPECQYYDGTPEEYRDGNDIWPRGRDLHMIGIYSQAYDFFRFMWNHTKPYTSVILIMVLALMEPFQVVAVSYVLQYIQTNPKSAPLWIYYINFIGYIVEKCLFWRYEILVPMNSQRVQMRCVLLQQRARLPHDHPVAKKWPTGRFIGLLKDVDDAINRVWGSMLDMIRGVTTIIYFIVVSHVHLGLVQRRAGSTTEHSIKTAAVFFFLAVFTMVLPVIWFRLFYSTVQEGEQLIRDGQALYMSLAYERLTLHDHGGLLQPHDQSAKDCDSTIEERKEADRYTVQAFWLYGRATFRSYFHRLAWQTNFGFISYLWIPLVAYFLLNGAPLASGEILVIILSLHNIHGKSVLLLDTMISMSQGLKVLRDIAEILNADFENYEPIDLEVGQSIISIWSHYA